MKPAKIASEKWAGWNFLAGAVFMTIVAVCAYWPALTGDFIWDDDMLVTHNELVKASGGLYSIWFTTKPLDYWPLTNSSFWLEWRVWGMNSTGYHVTNVLLHIGSALLVWTILRRLSIPGGFLAGLIFLVHPVNVESVAWIAQRKNTLSMLFFLVAIYWYLKDEFRFEAPRTGENPSTTVWYWLSVLAFAAAMLAKGSVVMLPLILLLIAWWMHARISRRDLWRSVPYFFIGGVLTIVNLWFQSHGRNVTIRHATFLQRLLGAGTVIWAYLYKAIVPVNLAFVYPQWIVDPTKLLWWIPLLMTLAVSAYLLWKRRTRWGRVLLFVWAYYCLALVPVMGFTDVYFMRYSPVADHYQYIAMIGVAALTAAAIDRGLDRIIP